MANISNFNYNNFNKYLKKMLSICIFMLFIFIIIFSFLDFKKKGYLLFIEFNNAYGLKQGTNVNFRGVKVGSVDRISIHLNKVVVLLNINSLQTLIPRKSLIEANQIGLFNDIVIDITPLDNIDYSVNQSISVTSNECSQSLFMCHNFYIKGYKGLNYDDLVRATTRIAQRFDDPRFFSVFYLLLQNSINISDEIILFIQNSSSFFYFLIDVIHLFILKYLL
uniref:Mce/MlaD domain-containing protein n=1 Tax=Thaumatella adunca TaxID=2006976 RepID=A0A1Z1MNN5_9FLOR|nr:hypothetical protein [Thaumatella adunca]ARW67395.1 hypothetical protein [Thaumatella adunca]